MFQDVSKKKKSLLMLSFYSSSTWSYFSPSFWILNEENVSKDLKTKVTQSTWEVGCVEGTHMPKSVGQHKKWLYMKASDHKRLLCLPFSLPHGYVFTFVTLQILLKGDMFGFLVAKCFTCS